MVGRRGMRLLRLFYPWVDCRGVDNDDIDNSVVGATRRLLVVRVLLNF